MIDPLESRILLIGSIFNGVLRISGFTDDDYFRLNVGTTQTVLTLGNATQYFATSAYNSILVEAGEGNDWIRIEGEFSRPATINGGGGNDTIMGSQQIEWIDGGTGNDVIYYQLGDVIDPQEPGDDEFFFGIAPVRPQPTLINGVVRVTGMPFSERIVVEVWDTVFPYLHISYSGGGKSFNLGEVQSLIVDGRGGNDRIQMLSSVLIPTRLYGGTGNDTIMGGSGSDRVYGGDGNDWIAGYGGNDVLYGENGNDRLFGGDGRDYIVGGPGSDLIRGENGVDHILATSGLDDFRGNAGDLISLI